MLSRALVAKIAIVSVLLMTAVYLTSPSAAFLAEEESKPADEPPAAATPYTLAEVKIVEPVGSNSDKTVQSAAGHWVTSENALSVRFVVNTDHSGKLSVLVNAAEVGKPEAFDASTNQKDIPIRLLAGSNRISAKWTPDDEKKRVVSTSELITIVQDKSGPILNHVEIVGTAETGFSLLVHFNDSDLKQTSVQADAFAVHPLTEQGGIDTSKNAVTHAHYVNPNTVQVILSSLEPRRYQLTIHGTRATVLKDLVDNAAGNGEPQTRVFAPIPTAQTGPRVEFPEFLPTIPQPQTERRPNPGDRVETRVARLYYFRDAHRVSQIINRITQSYNRAAVTQAQRRAEDARLTAEQLTEERRARERAAVEAAQATRRIEQQLQAAHQELQRLRLVEIAASKVDDLKGTINTGQMKDVVLGKAKVANARVQSPGGDRQVEEEVNVQSQIHAGTILSGSVQGAIANSTLNGIPTEGFVKTSQAVGGSISSGFASGKIIKGTRENNEIVGTFEGDISAATISGVQLQEVVLTPSSGEDTTGIKDRIQAITRQIPDLQQAINAHRSVELAVAEEAQQLQSREDRAVAEQFRQQVAAAHEDPDTYAPATLDSWDPVAQVSLSVIGEGLLHLRGPIRGINTVRRMIHQIDAPVGQVRVQIHTVQINGERGDQMEQVAGRVEGYVDLGRFLTNQSLLLLRRAVVQEAAQVAQMAGLEGHYQVDRDRRYLYTFFGRDFIDEMYEMDSEFLRSENKLLSLHSMDTISLNQALFIMALARNDVRERIVQRFMHLVQTELPQAEWDFRRSSELYPHKTRTHLPFTNRSRIEQNTMERVFLNAQQRYHFRNVRSFFENDSNWCGAGMDFASFEGSGYTDPNTMNSMQRTFLRLAQIFKSQMIAEAEVKQRVIERAIIEDAREESFRQEAQQMERLRAMALDALQEARLKQAESQRNLINAVTEVQKGLLDAQQEVDKLKAHADALQGELEKLFKEQTDGNDPNERTINETASSATAVLDALRKITRQPLTDQSRRAEQEASQALQEFREMRETDGLRQARLNLGEVIRETKNAADARGEDWEMMEKAFQRFAEATQARPMDWKLVVESYRRFEVMAKCALPESSPLLESTNKAWKTVDELNLQLAHANLAKEDVIATRAPLDHKKLLDFLIDEREEKHIELLEGTRSYIAAVDQYLKRLSTALEDDFKVQFYDPAFTLVRAAAREHSVTLGQVERTTILMNNRAIAIVKPSATMEFDLPKRDIVIVEALEGAKALAQDYGALLNDPTFLAAFQMMGGATQPSTIKSMYPGLSSTTDAEIMGLPPSASQQSPSALQGLVPEPAIYKFETGTGFEIRPVIQPDGDSVVYDFNYMYTTNVREPVRADEKHLGRIKRHFIDTQVQTSSFELREISRYQVALKAARTSRGVPLLEDIPGVGVLFRPLPSAESSLQQNIILGQSTVYPTLFDLMGLRWARHVVDLEHVGLRDAEHIVRGRNQSMEDFVFDKASKEVDEFLNIRREYPQHHRPDLYHQQRQPTPYHPGGYMYPEKIEDPSGEDFRIRDRRPAEMQMQPPYEDRFRRPYSYEGIEFNPPVSATSEQPLQLAPVPASRSELRIQSASPVAGESAARRVQSSVAPASYQQIQQRHGELPQMRRIPPVEPDRLPDDGLGRPLPLRQ